MKNLAGFNCVFRFTGQKHICPGLKDERRADSTLKNPTIKRKTFMKNQTIMFTSVLLAVACFTVTPMALGRPVPTPTPTPTATPYLGEDRGNGNSAAENVYALNGWTTGSNNTAHGWMSLFSNTTGQFNTADGNQALYTNTTGEGNTANGAYALYSNTDGSSNTATGTLVLGANTTGIGNTGTGYEALSNNTVGNGNTASGVNALLRNTSGNYNTATGSQALNNNSTGVNNTAEGFMALAYNEGDNNTAAGCSALQSNTTGVNNTAHGWGAVYSNTTGSRNTADGVYALYSNTTGDSNTAIGIGADVAAGNLTNATAIGADSVVDASNKVRIGNSSVTVIEGQVAYTFSSDRNKKENFHAVDGEEVLRKIRQFNLTSWNYIGQDAKTLRHYGPMAQDFYEAFGHDAVGTVGTPKTINSGDMAGIMMVAIKALAMENVQLKSAVTTQEAVNAEQRQRLEALTAHLEQQDKTIQKVSAQIQMRQPRMSLARINP